MLRRYIFFSSLQVEGRGNGIKTCVVNNVEIAKALERPPECKAKQNIFAQFYFCSVSTCVT